MALDIQQLVKSGAKQGYRKLFMKRIQNDGAYEPDWFEITPYVSSYGTIKKSFGDNLFLGDYQISGITVRLDNRNRFFNDPDEANSFFRGFKTRIKTKFKIEAGFLDDTDPLDPDREELALTFFGIMFSEPVTNDSGIATFKVASIMKVLQLFPATGVAVTSTTSSGMVDRLLKKEVNGQRVFDQFIEGADDSERYQITSSSDTITTPLIQDDETVWEKIKDYSFYENFFLYVNQSGNLVWDDRDPTVSVKWIFNGAGSFNNDYAINIVSVDSETAGVDHTWTRASIEYIDDTFKVSESSWTPGDGSTQDIYGERTFSETKLELGATQAQNVADRIRSNLGAPKRRWRISTVFIPQLELKDNVQLNYVGELTVTNPFILGLSTLGGPDVLGGRANSINLLGVTAKISEIEINLDSFDTRFELIEV